MLPAFDDLIRNAQPSEGHAISWQDIGNLWRAWLEGLTHVPDESERDAFPPVPQYCGHCTRMDRVGQRRAAECDQAEVSDSLVQIPKEDRYQQMMVIAGHSVGARTVVVSGGDIAMCHCRWVGGFFCLQADGHHEYPRHSLATKGLIAIPQFSATGSARRSGPPGQESTRRRRGYCSAPRMLNNARTGTRW